MITIAPHVAIAAFGLLIDAVEGTSVEKVRIEQHSFGGFLWFAGWLFTIGFLQLAFWKGVLAMVLWPVYLGYAFSPLLGVVAKLGH